MIKRIFYLLFFPVFLISCNTYTSMMNADTRVKGLSIGMTREQVVSVMGEEYEVVEADGNVVVLGYKSYDEGIYKLRFVDGKLLNWKKVWLNKYESEDRRISHTVSTGKDNTSLRDHLNAHRNAMLSTATTDSEKAAVNTHMDAHQKAVLGE